MRKIKPIEILVLIGLTIFGVVNYGNYFHSSLKMARQGDGYWEKWALSAFKCLETQIHSLPRNSSVEVNVKDGLLNQRLIELGFGYLTFNKMNSDYEITSSVYPRPFVNHYKCGNWDTYIFENKK
jgi:hypothetical protein